MNLDLGKSNWSRLKNQPVLTFKPAHIKGLALVLKQTETTVARAALESMGIHLQGYQDGDVAAAVENNASLSNRDKRILLSLFHELVTPDADDQPAATTQHDLDLAAFKGEPNIAPDQLPE